MATWIRRVVETEIRGLHQAAYLLASLVFISQLLGLLRDRLLAYTFGASSTLDVYYAAFRIPDLLFVLIASSVSVFVLVPFIEERMLESLESVRRFLSELFTALVLVLGTLSLAAAFGADSLATYLYPSINGAAHETLVLLMRIMLMQPLLLCVSSLLSAVVQVRQRFVLFAVAPILYNIGILIGIVVLNPLFGSVGLAYGVVLGALLHLTVQAPYVWRQRLFPQLVLFSPRTMLRVVSVSLPRTLALSSQQLILTLLVALATSLESGSLAILMLAFNLQSVPLALVASSYSVAAFPTLSRLYVTGQRDAFVLHVQTSLRYVLFWSMPLCAAFVALQFEIVDIVLGTGSFYTEDTSLTALTLGVLSSCLVAQVVSVQLVRAAYAAAHTWLPLYASVLATVSALLLVVFVRTPIEMLIASSMLGGTQHIAGNTTGILALASIFAIAMFAQVLILILLFELRIAPITRVIFGAFVRNIPAALAAGVSMNVMVHVLAVAPSTSSVLVRGALAGLVGVLIWLAVMWLARNRELLEMTVTFRAERSKKGVTLSPER